MKMTMIVVALMIPAAWAIPAENVPHVDKVFLHAPEQRTDLVAAIVDDLKPFCETVAKASPNEQKQMAVTALESCYLSYVIDSLQKSEAELKIENGESFMMLVGGAPFDEDAAWHYFMRTQMLHRLMRSLRAYFSGGADSAGQVRVGMIGIPALAGSLDNYSYWSRLIAMKEAASCPNESLQLCKILEAQFIRLGQFGWTTAEIPAKGFSVSDNSVYINSLAKTIETRLSSMTFDELDQLDKMDNVTSAGLGIPFFRQLLKRLNIANADFNPATQRQLQNAIMLGEIQDALKSWGTPPATVDVDHDAVELLTVELNALVKSSGGAL